VQLHYSQCNYTPGIVFKDDVTLNAGISTQMVTIPILDNTIVADSTSFNVILTTTDPAVVLNPTTADVTIEDDDSE